MRNGLFMGLGESEYFIYYLVLEEVFVWSCFFYYFRIGNFVVLILEIDLGNGLKLMLLLFMNWSVNVKIM